MILDISKAGINWNDINVVSRTVLIGRSQCDLTHRIKWNDFGILSRAGVNWNDINLD